MLALAYPADDSLGTPNARIDVFDVASGSLRGHIETSSETIDELELSDDGSKLTGVFDHVALAAEPDTLAGSGGGKLVAVASEDPIEVTDFVEEMGAADLDWSAIEGAVLERWIDARAGEGTPFAVLGDWNRRLAAKGDAFFAEIDDAEPANADLTLAAGTSGATCKARYREFIDHIALDKQAAAAAVPGSFAEYTYGVSEDRHPSDHCPVSVAIVAR